MGQPLPIRICLILTQIECNIAPERAEHHPAQKLLSTGSKLHRRGVSHMGQFPAGARAQAHSGVSASPFCGRYARVIPCYENHGSTAKSGGQLQRSASLWWPRVFKWRAWPEEVGQTVYTAFVALLGHTITVRTSTRRSREPIFALFLSL